MNKLLLEKIQQRLNQKEIKYMLRDGVISFNMDIEGAVGKLSMVIITTDEAYVTYATLSSNAAPEYRRDISEYLHRANYGLLFGNFELDVDDGEIRYKIITDCEDGNRLSNRLIDKSILLPCYMFEQYGSGIIKLMLGVGSPEELISEAEKVTDKN